MTDLTRRRHRSERGRPSKVPMLALVVTARDEADAAAQTAEAVIAGRHSPGWPAIVIIESQPERGTRA